MNGNLPSWDRRAPGIEAPHPGVITLGPVHGADTSAGTTPAVRLPFASAAGGRPFALGQARLPLSRPTNPHPGIPAAARLPLGEGLSADPRGESLRLAGGVTDEDLTKHLAPQGSGCGARSPGGSTAPAGQHTNQLRPMPADPALGATSQPRMVAATAAWEASDHTPGRLLHSSVMPTMPVKMPH